MQCLSFIHCFILLGIIHSEIYFHKVIKVKAFLSHYTSLPKALVLSQH